MSRRLDTADVECAKAPVFIPRPINNFVLPSMALCRAQQATTLRNMQRNNCKAVDETYRDKTSSSPSNPVDWSIIHHLGTHIVSMPLFQYVNGNNIIIERRVGSAVIPHRWSIMYERNSLTKTPTKYMAACCDNGTYLYSLKWRRKRILFMFNLSGHCGSGCRPTQRVCQLDVCTCWRWSRDTWLGNHAVNGARNITFLTRVPYFVIRSLEVQWWRLTSSL